MAQAGTLGTVLQQVVDEGLLEFASGVVRTEVDAHAGNPNESGIPERRAGAAPNRPRAVGGAGDSVEAEHRGARKLLVTRIFDLTQDVLGARIS
ncbi:hypothetical protein [Mycobacterium sp. 155]|uniref:hypothetical protein n=1 Tax=Mycobacterium sp. 155 TaxID=1157943 RepID=UPI00036623A1|nr:hypothetical protein [Mycobacterium sp. 155]